MPEYLFLIAFILAFLAFVGFAKILYLIHEL